MKLLLDTHIYLWYIANDSNLPVRYLNAIRDPDNDIYLSIASTWETVIKYHLGKLPLPHPPASYLRKQRIAHGIFGLNINEAAMPHLALLPLLHRDPFDRILIAQTLQHGLTIVTVDPQIMAYSVPYLQ